ncbi:potassium channel family protein [Falsihalocynthiibacter arcticus]|uniref:Potassium channel domain-containing protein n=1 Tax=Falsihalocynthiibacter arcticus TaxID=1579316 RepID=A0A126UWS9_9RHOB|nr:potassium channel family protein [Falsihalocynthiibacter arcticus]AML50538.1 hypothetical protein RC74_03965 [Falsihalocynthiibacter arcticus]
MELTGQILSGTGLLSLCAILHVVLVSKSVDAIPHFSKRIENLSYSWRLPIFVGVTFVMVVFSLTLQVWIWAISFIYIGAFSDWPTSVYFSLVTFTTLGYGDITLGPEHRVFAAFAAVTGLLTFGISTAFLVGLVSRVLSLSPVLDAAILSKKQP